MGSSGSVLRRIPVRPKARRETTTIRLSFPIELPPEIIDIIFVLASSNSKSDALALSKVSRSSRRLAIPFLFETLVFEHRAHASTHVEILRANPAIATVVKALWIRECTPKEVELFSLCSNLERLAVTPQAFSALCKYGNSIWRQNSRDATKIALPRELLLFPGVIDWDIPNEDGPIVATHGPYSAAFLDNLTRLHLSQSSQLLSLQTVPVPLSSLMQLATPLAGTSLSPIDILGSYRFPNLRALSVLPRPRNDPGLSPRCQFAATQWDADGLAEGVGKDEHERVIFVDNSDISDVELLEGWKNARRVEL